MILVGGTAVSAAAARDLLGQSGRLYGRLTAIEGPWILTASHVLLGWSLAALGCQAWRRRGRIGRRVGRWPGTVACLAVFVAAVVNLLYAWTIGLARTGYARVFLSVSL